MPEHLSRLENLTSLNLGGNQLTELPEWLIEIPGFSKLEVQNQLWGGTGILNIANNNISNPPGEVLDQGLDAVKDYFRQLREEGTDQLYEAKLLIVGEPEAGKTTLAKKVKNPNYQLSPLPSTEGIDVLHWDFPHTNGTTFRVNIWDFGGQEIYKETHQFFLTRRSCYVLVADNRKEDDNLYYWLNIIETLADGSPILIVKNEKGDRSRDLNENQLRADFPQLKDSLATNLATDRGWQPLLTQIRHHLSTLPHIGDELPKTWVRVRKALETAPRNTIPLETYLDLCKEHGFRHTTDALQLSQYLHDLGVFLHFQDDDLLRKTIILKPNWGTTAVYKILDDKTIQEKQGQFTHQDRDRIWGAEEYTELRGELLRLMMKFQLCYELPHRKHHYIAPQLLSAKSPDYPWDPNQNLILRYTYDFMPKGILTGFIVAKHRLIANHPKHKNQQIVWRTGVCLQSNDTVAEIIELQKSQEIRIRIQGSQKRDLLSIIIDTFDEIHDRFPRLNYQQLIPCNCATCKDSQDPHTYPLEVLRYFDSNHQSEIQCQKSFQMVNIYGLIDDIGKREKLLRDRPTPRHPHSTPTPHQPDIPPIMADPTPPPNPNPLDKIKALPVWAQLISALVTLTLATFGVVQILPPQSTETNPNPSQTSTPETPEKIPQEIYVYDAETDQPLSRVDVRFLAPGGAIGDRTNSDGFTELTVPKSEDIDIELRKEGYETQIKKLNLVTDPEKRKTYYLKPNR